MACIMYVLSINYKSNVAYRLEFIFWNQIAT